MFFLKKEGQEVKACPLWGGWQWEGGRHKKRMKEGEYGGCILYSCIK
jgi:hypothetical protein